MVAAILVLQNPTSQLPLNEAIRVDRETCYPAILHLSKGTRQRPKSEVQGMWRGNPIGTRRKGIVAQKGVNEHKRCTFHTVVNDLPNMIYVC